MICPRYERVRIRSGAPDTTRSSVLPAVGTSRKKCTSQPTGSGLQKEKPILIPCTHIHGFLTFFSSWSGCSRLFFIRFSSFFGHVYDRATLKLMPHIDWQIDDNMKENDDGVMASWLHDFMTSWRAYDPLLLGTASRRSSHPSIVNIIITQSRPTDNPFLDYSPALRANHILVCARNGTAVLRWLTVIHTCIRRTYGHLI